MDGEGRVLRRDELIGGTVDEHGNVSNAAQNRFHNYYLFDDRQVGNDGIDRIVFPRYFVSIFYFRSRLTGAGNAGTTPTWG